MSEPEVVKYSVIYSAGVEVGAGVHEVCFGGIGDKAKLDEGCGHLGLFQHVQTRARKYSANSSARGCGKTL